jgi:hypothetical protein
MKTIQKLKELGWRVDIRHYREYHNPSTGHVLLSEAHLGHAFQVRPDARGGITMMTVYRNGLKHGSITTVHPNDNYCKKVGVRICLNRLPDEVWR